MSQIKLIMVNNFFCSLSFRWFQGFDFESLSNLTLKPPQISCVNGPLDLSNFDTFATEYEMPADETSGWDESF